MNGLIPGEYGLKEAQQLVGAGQCIDPYSVTVEENINEQIKRVEAHLRELLACKDEMVKSGLMKIKLSTLRMAMMR